MEQMVSEASLADGKDATYFGRRTVPRWAKAFARQTSARVRLERTAAAPRAARYSLAVCMSAVHECKWLQFIPVQKQ